MPHRACFAAVLLILPSLLRAGEVVTLPGTQPLTAEGDLSEQMRRGFERFLLGELDRSIAQRGKLWNRDFSSREAYEQSVEPNRARLRRITGAVDPRLPVTALEYVSSTDTPAQVAQADGYSIHAVRWPVFDGVHGEGLLLVPGGEPLARLVALPDADQTPEMLVGLAPGMAPEAQFARRLAESGCLVVVPVLVDRADTWSGKEGIAWTNQTHREWIYRQAFEMGRHIIGYEVQKVSALVDWFEHESRGDNAGVGVAGYGEGGLIALYAAALDPRIDAALVSGYFDSRQRIWDEPIYRNVLGILREFGDAEVASLVAPRPLVIEHSAAPEVAGPPEARDGRRANAAPGRLATPQFESVAGEVARLRELCPASPSFAASVELVAGPDGDTIGPGSPAALASLLKGLGAASALADPGDETLVDSRGRFDPAPRQQRQVSELVEHNQRLMRQSHPVRKAFWSKADTSSVERWRETTRAYRGQMWDELVGRFPPASLPPAARTRKIYDTPKWIGYEVMFDVWPNVFGWGYLLVPKDLEPGERRPVVVCQHGLEGVPADVVNTDPASAAYPVYKGFAAKLADRGFVTYAPHNFYRGGNDFRQLQRKAHPLKKTLFGITTIQHQQMLDWLSSLEFVAPDRIGFYGLSYGGNTAVRVPALLERYAAVISSGDFNEWVVKNVTVDDGYAMIYHNVYEVFEFDLGHTFNHADMAGLIAPRPFMVERGHTDGVAHDEWVAAEYAKVRRLYAFLGIPDRTTIEFFNGPHTINGAGTFEFLERHLNWPAR